MTGSASRCAIRNGGGNDIQQYVLVSCERQRRRVLRRCSLASHRIVVLILCLSIQLGKETQMTTKCAHCGHTFHNALRRRTCPRCGGSLAANTSAPKPVDDSGFDVAGFAVGLASGLPISPAHGISTGAMLGAALHTDPVRAEPLPGAPVHTPPITPGPPEVPPVPSPQPAPAPAPPDPPAPSSSFDSGGSFGGDGSAAP